MTLVSIAVAASIYLSGCVQEVELSNNRRTSYVSLALSLSEGNINVDKHLWEDRVDEIRMVVFNTAGDVVYNSQLYFPNGFASPCKAVRLTPGKYDFCFVGNESAVSNEFADAIATLRNRSELQSNAVFSSLPYQPDFMPDGETGGGRFVMSAFYTGIDVLSGGTELRPITLPLPQGKVFLQRALAKVEIVFRKKTAGGTIPAGLITKLELKDVAATYTVPSVGSVAYNGTTTDSGALSLDGLDYTRDSVGTVLRYIPELLNITPTSGYTSLTINDRSYPVEVVSPYNIARNNHYIINVYLNAAGGVEVTACVQPWNKESYKYMFQDEDRTSVTPPITPTDSSLIVPTDCGKIEILSKNEVLQQGLMGAFGDEIVWWDPTIGGPTINKGAEPYYCEKKYGKGWRFINSCELMSFLKLFDQTYRIWQSNTWQAVNAGVPYYSLPFRQEAQVLLGKLTGVDMSKYVTSDAGKDTYAGEKLGMLDQYFTPGDILVRASDYPAGKWSYYGKVNNNGQDWFPMEVSIQIKGYWYSDYLDFSDEANYDKILYGEFYRYDYSSTISRCVRNVE
ncbi:MAG: FimB/Mfa2 family fimbrial subunit [Mediterranea sp.]|nr:FimB/Mfa2 family fimbrial subunit [Mediterranea sp.]